MAPELAADATPSADAEVGRRIHMLMWDRQVKQSDLAAQLGIQQSALSKKLRGYRAWSLDDLKITAAWLGTTIAYLVGEVGDPKWCTPRDLNPEPTVIGSRVAPVVSIDMARSLRAPLEGDAA